MSPPHSPANGVLLQPPPPPPPSLPPSLLGSHLQPNGGYRWVVTLGDAPAAAGASAHAFGAADNIRTYGMAFAVLAYATALRAGVAEAAGWLADTTAVLTARLWEEAHGLYADEASGDWATTAAYRGSNANMHALEAHLAAWAASADPAHLARARIIAHALTVRQAARVQAVVGEALTYEHYTT